MACLPAATGLTLIHCHQGLDRAAGVEAGMGEQRTQELLARLALFVCMLPRARLASAPANLAERRRKFVMRGGTGPHHPLLSGLLHPVELTRVVFDLERIATTQLTG